MRGIVTLAAALALPAGFPHRDFILLTAFVVVLGTLVIQGLTLRPLLLLLRLPRDGIVETEIRLARKAALKAAMAELENDDTPAAQRLKLEYAEALDHAWRGQDPRDTPDNALRRQALGKSRRAIHELRSTGAIGDDAYRRVEEELDWLELSARPAQTPDIAGGLLGAAERVLRVGAEDMQPGGEVVELLEGAGDGGVVGVALDVGVELGGRKLAVDHVALELGHVHAVGGEAAHRLVERRRQVADAEDEAGQHVATRRRDGLRRHGEEAGGVVRLVLDVARQHLQPVDVGRQAPSERAEAGSPACATASAEPAVSAPARVSMLVGAQEAAALPEQRRLAHGARMSCSRAPADRAGSRGPDEVLADDVQAGFGQQVVDVGDAAVDRVLDRQHGEVGPALAQRRDGALEAVAGQRFERGKASTTAWCE